ncbi:MAG: nitroreductase family protein, partial [Rhodobacteraceae bacterium]
MFAKQDLKFDPIALPDHIDMPPEEMQKAAADFLAHMRKRHSVRDFTDQPV